MNLIIISFVAFLLSWVFLDIQKEKLGERYRFKNSTKPGYGSVLRSLYGKLCDVDNSEQLEIAISFVQGILIILAFVASLIGWILYVPEIATVITLLSLVLATVLPYLALKSWRAHRGKGFESEVSIIAPLLMIRARPDESLDHMIADVLDAVPGRSRGSIKGLVATGIGQFKLNGQFIEAMENIDSRAPHLTVKRLTDSLSSWYSDAENGHQHLDILVRELEAVDHLKQALESRFRCFSAGSLMFLVMLVTVLLFLFNL